MACATSPRSHSSKRTTEGKIGRPAASAEVHRSGRIAFDVRSNVDACDASQPEAVLRICQNSYSLPRDGSTTIAWRSPSPWRWMSSSVPSSRGSAEASSLCRSGQFSIGVTSGTGKGPASDSFG
jgi:hypothetical protein